MREHDWEFWDSNDLKTVGYACEVMKRFKPVLTVVNLSNVDGCHFNFTSYLRALHRADHAVGHIWDFIQYLSLCIGS